MSELKYNRKYLETPGCAYCDNANYLSAIDYYMPIDKKVCEKRKCKQYENLREVINFHSNDEGINKIIGKAYP